MISLLKSISHLFQISPSLPQDRDSRYLAQATDLYDLERRMRQLDAGRQPYDLPGDYSRFLH